MSQKSIGTFIAALRKANGLTQKDLAEKLNVSDKTISRWERDEGTPDLSLIPAIAEIFGVTCDELLRGERNAPRDCVTDTYEENTTSKGARQRQRLLASGLTQYRNRSYIAMGVSLIGLFAAMILNLGFLYAIVGFSVALVFLVVGVVCEAIFLNNALAAVDSTDEDEDLYNYKRSVIRLGERTFGLDIFLLGILLPLLFVDAYLGISASSWLTYGLLSAAVLSIFYIVICWAVNASLIKRGILRMDKTSELRYWKTHRVQRKCGISLCIILAITLIIQMGVNSIDETSFASGTSFEDYDSFTAYMEEEASTSSINSSVAEEMPEAEYETEDDSDTVLVYQAYTENEDVLFFDENGTPISEDYVNSLSNVTYGDALTDSEGNLLCKWVWRNQSVTTIHYGKASDGYLPICVYDDQSMTLANAVLNRINIAFVFAYLGEIIIAIIIYRKIRKNGTTA